MLSERGKKAEKLYITQLHQANNGHGGRQDFCLTNKIQFKNSIIIQNQIDFRE